MRQLPPSELEKASSLPGFDLEAAEDSKARNDLAANNSEEMTIE